jgi:hypothetical protein
MTETKNFKDLSPADRDIIVKDLNHSSKTAGANYAKYYDHVENAVHAHSIYQTQIRQSPWETSPVKCSKITKDIVDVEVDTECDPEQEEQFAVHAILEHRCLPTENIEVLVQWEGCTKAQSTWEPLSALISLPVVQQYFQTLN